MRHIFGNIFRDWRIPHFSSYNETAHGKKTLELHSNYDLQMAEVRILLNYFIDNIILGIR